MRQTRPRRLARLCASVAFLAACLASSACGAGSPGSDDRPTPAPRDDIVYTGPPFRQGPFTFGARTHVVPADLSGLPELARESTAIMEIQLDREGRVVTAQMLRGVRDDIDERALAAVRQWRHEPMRLAEPVHAPDGTTWPAGTAVPLFITVTMQIPPHQPR